MIVAWGVTQGASAGPWYCRAGAIRNRWEFPVDRMRLLTMAEDACTWTALKLRQGDSWSFQEILPAHFRLYSIKVLCISWYGSGSRFA